MAAMHQPDPRELRKCPANNIHLPARAIKPGRWILRPGGSRPSSAKFIETAGGKPGANGCPAGSVARGFFSWAAGNHFLSGNDYSGGHPGIDIAAREGDAIYAADSGVVTMSQDGWNYGYGNIIQIDHGNGFVTL